MANDAFFNPTVAAQGQSTEGGQFMQEFGNMGVGPANPNFASASGRVLSTDAPGAMDSLKAALKFVQQYDPNAKINTTAYTGGDDPNATQSNLQFDSSKLPQMPKGDQVAPSTTFLQNQQRQNNMGGGDQTITQMDPSQIQNNSFYGNVIPQNAVKDTVLPSKKTGVDVWGPLAVGAISGLGAFDPEMGFLGGGMDLGGSGGLGQFAGQLAGQTVESGGQNLKNPLGIGLSALGASGLGGSIPGLGDLGQYMHYIQLAMNAAKNPVGTAVNYGMSQAPSFLGKLFQGG